VFGSQLNEIRLHSIERLIQVLKNTPLVASPEFTYRVIAEKWRDSPLSAIGAFERGGRYNAPHTFPVLYSAGSPVTALREAEALFMTADGQLQGVPRDPELVLTLECTLFHVLDLTVADLYSELRTSREELVSLEPSRFIVNARNEETPTQQLGLASVQSGRISALKVPSAQDPEGYCLNIFLESLVIGERVSILDKSGRLAVEVKGSSTDRPSATAANVFSASPPSEFCSREHESADRRFHLSGNSRAAATYARRAAERRRPAGSRQEAPGRNGANAERAV
jgi:RES domain-containing protein